jgi:hypothetical protein
VALSLVREGLLLLLRRRRRYDLAKVNHANGRRTVVRLRRNVLLLLLLSLRMMMTAMKTTRLVAFDAVRDGEPAAASQ